MNFRTLFFFPVFLLSISLTAQTILKVYHGANGESQIYNSANEVINKSKIKLKQGDVVNVSVVNANPLLYSYTLKYENIPVESEDKAITDLLTTFGTILSGRAGVLTQGFVVAPTDIDELASTIDVLTNDIDRAKAYIIESDNPETPGQALAFSRDAGLRKALQSISLLPNSKFRFNDPNLLSDLNEFSDKVFNANEFSKKSMRLLNISLVEKINEIKKQTNLRTVQTVWRNEVKATDSSTKITLIITKIDPNNSTLVRDGGGENKFELELGTMVPFYKRATLEMVPVANFIFSQNVKEYYLDNNIIQNRNKSKTTLSPGVVLNVNIANFGENKEMSVGIGPGYQFSSKGDALENFYFSGMFSYKNFLRIGGGFGFAQFPADKLKGGGTVGQPLPSNVENLNDLIEYEEKPSFFLTLSFTGLNLTKKK